MKRLTLIGLVLLISISSGLFFDYSAPKTASASIIDKVELTDQRTRTSKTYWLGETPEGNKRYAIESSINSIHYLSGGQWLDIDSAIIPSTKSGWDWEVEKGQYTLLIKNDTSVAVGKEGQWVGFRYEGFAYLDKSDNEYVILDKRRAVTPTVEGNRICWEDIFYGVNLEYIYGNDGFKENLEITQVARDWLKTHPPSSYGLNNQTSYLVGYIQCDWRYASSATIDGEAVDWNTDIEVKDTPINFWNGIKTKVISALPVGYAYSVANPVYEPLKLNKRFIKANDDNHYLLFGAPVVDLNRFPSGTVVFDPSIDVQTSASNYDAYENESTGAVTITGNYLILVSSSAASSRRWAGALWDAAIPKGSTITTANVTGYVYSTYDDADAKLYFEMAASPAVFTTDTNDIQSRNKTEHYVSYVVSNLTNDAWNTAPSLVEPLQDVVDAYTTTTIAMIGVPNQVNSNTLYWCQWDRTTSPTHTWGMKLYVEYDPPVGAEAPTVVTNAATSVEEATATLSGNITDTGGENPTHRGFYWDTDSGNPYADNWFESGDWGVGEFTHGLTLLTEGEMYYFMASANNTGGTGNGTEQMFLLKPDEPTSIVVTDQTSSNITISWTNGDGRDTTLVRYRTDEYPTDETDGTLSYNGTATSTVITSLDAGQIHYIRIWSWCTEGGLEQYSDAYDEIIDYTLPGDPSDMVSENVTENSIDIRWTMGDGGDYTMVRRKVDSYPTSVTDGSQAYYNTDDNFSDIGLGKGMDYYYRAWARDTDSGYYSEGYIEATETTLTTAPTVTNASGATNIQSTSARINGDLTDDGGESCNVTMFWGLSDGSDNETAWEHEVDKGSLTTGTFYENLASLNVTTQYFYICKAINTQGTDWADSTDNFTTLEEGMDLLPPTDFVATYINENRVLLAWTLGAFAEYTMVRANYGSPPENIEQGYCIYYGAGENATDTIVELNLRDDIIYYSAWSENTTMSWSADSATAYVESEAMSEAINTFLPLIIVLGILALAHFTAMPILLLAAGFGTALYGFSLWATAWWLSIVVVLIGLGTILRALAGQRRET